MTGINQSPRMKDEAGCRYEVSNLLPIDCKLFNDETTAHESGIFRYSSQSAEGEEEALFIHFEALLIKKDQWQMMMEYQKSAATREEWDALK